MSHQVIGLHIGSLGSVVGRFKDRVVDVVLSDSSNRQVPTVVSYNDRDRNFGDMALQTIKSNFKRTFIYPNRFLGIQKNWPFLNEESKYSNIKPVLDQTGKIGFNVNYKGKEDFYTPESLMGLYFSKIKNNWTREGIDTDDIVVSIPDYFTVYERKAMLEAIQISGIKCSDLINDSSATSFSYGLLRLN